MALQLIGAKKNGNYLYVTIQGDSQEEAVSPEARRMAYDARGDWGFENSGIEAVGGTMPVDMMSKDDDGAVGKPLSEEDLKGLNQVDHKQKVGYRAVFRLMRGL